MTLLESLLTSYEYFDYRHGDNVDEGSYNGLCDGVFDTRDVEA